MTQSTNMVCNLAARECEIKPDKVARSSLSLLLSGAAAAYSYSSSAALTSVLSTTEEGAEFWASSEILVLHAEKAALSYGRQRRLRVLPRRRLLLRRRHSHHRHHSRRRRLLGSQKYGSPKGGRRITKLAGFFGKGKYG